MSWLDVAGMTRFVDTETNTTKRPLLLTAPGWLLPLPGVASLARLMHSVTPAWRSRKYTCARPVPHSRPEVPAHPSRLLASEKRDETAVSAGHRRRTVLVELAAARRDAHPRRNVCLRRGRLDALARDEQQQYAGAQESLH